MKTLELNYLLCCWRCVRNKRKQTVESRFITSAFTAVILYEARRPWDVEFFFHLMFLLWFLIFKPGIVQQGFLLGLGDIFSF